MTTGILTDEILARASGDLHGRVKGKVVDFIATLQASPGSRLDRDRSTRPAREPHCRWSDGVME